MRKLIILQFLFFTFLMFNLSYSYGDFYIETKLSIEEQENYKKQAEKFFLWFDKQISSLSLKKQEKFIISILIKLDNAISYDKKISDKKKYILSYLKYNFEQKHEMSAELVKSMIEKTISLSKKDSITFSNSQIQDILIKIDKNSKKQQELEKNSTKILAQGDFKAEYIKPKDYWKDFDKIIVTISGKKYELSGVYGKEEMKKYTDAIKKWDCKIPDWMKDSYWIVLFNGKQYISPSSGDCLMMKDFSNFVSFSPSWYYLLYTTVWFETAHSRLIDIKTGKIIIAIPFSISASLWTTDKKQFIYWTEGGIGNWHGLYITKKWNFPEEILIQDKEPVFGIFADENYIYTIEWYPWEVSSWSHQYLKIYSLSTLKEVFSMKIMK